jgi:hypothetical protein
MYNNDAVLRIFRKVLQRELKDMSPLYIDNLIKEVRADVEDQSRCFASTMDMAVATIQLHREATAKLAHIDTLTRENRFAKEMSVCGGSQGFVAKHLVVSAQVTRSQLRALCDQFSSPEKPAHLFVLSDLLDAGPAFRGDIPCFDDSRHKVILLGGSAISFSELQQWTQNKILECEYVIVIGRADRGPVSMSYTDLLPKTKLINVGHIHLTYTED